MKRICAVARPSFLGSFFASMLRFAMKLTVKCSRPTKLAPSFSLRL